MSDFKEKYFPVFFHLTEILTVCVKKNWQFHSFDQNFSCASCILLNTFSPSIKIIKFFFINLLIFC